MKHLAILLLPILLLLSCKKTTTTGSGVRSFTGPNPATEGALLTREVYNFIAAGDSFVTTYQYDAARRLTAFLAWAPPQLNISYNYYYERDSHERIYRRISTTTGGNDTMNVYYADPTLGIVSYTVDQNGTAYRDSSVFIYDQDHYPTAIIIYQLVASTVQLVNVDSISYDAGRNVTAFRMFMPDSPRQLTLNLGYDFQYDNAINPLYSPDDCRIPDEGATILSPNNLLKQTNHYGDPPLLPSNYVTWTYQYRSDHKPLSATVGGNADAPGSTPIIIFEYQ